MKAIRNTVLLMFFLYSSFTMADVKNCKMYSSSCEITPLGVLLLEFNDSLNDEYSHITLNGISIYKVKTSFLTFYGDEELIKENGKSLVTKSIISYSKNGACITEDGEPYNCHANIIIDFTGDKPLISNEFFSDTGNSYLSWVSWGKLNSVIVFEDDSRFKYSKGHVERVKNEKQ